MEHDFMVIDDSELDCFIAEKMITHTVENSKTLLFTGAQEALEYVRSAAPGNHKRIIFLDILMPVMDGFAFMEAFEKLPANIQNNYLVVGLTSSMNKKDLAKITEYKALNRLLDKPLTADSVLALMEEIRSGKLSV